MNQMITATFDTLAAVRNLEKAGMGTSQAEAVTETIRVAVFQGVATKEDLDELRSGTKADIAELRSGTKADIAELRAEMKAEIGKLRSEMKAEIGKLRSETKAEIGELRSEMKAEIGELRSEMKAEIGELRVEIQKFRADMTWRMVVVVGGLLGLFTALDLFFLN